MNLTVDALACPFIHSSTFTDRRTEGNRDKAKEKQERRGATNPVAETEVLPTHIYTDTHAHIHIHIYLCTCGCVYIHMCV